MRFYEDITIGDRTELGRHTFGAEAIKAFARKFDPQPFHVDEEAAKRSHFGRLVASGWHTAAVCMRQNVDAKNREDAALRAAGKPVAASGPSPGVRDVRWLKPVYPGDTVTFASEIVGKREVSRPGYGLVTTVTTGTNQHGEPVYSAQGAVFVERRSK
jgi:acyl dehydratase